MLKQSELGSLAKVELSAELINDLLWELTLVDLDVLDVLATLELDLEDADWLLFLLHSSLAEVTGGLSGFGAHLDLWSLIS